MASGLSSAVLSALLVLLADSVSAGDKHCEGFTDMSNTYHSSKTCIVGFCCGTCYNRYCCSDTFWRLSEEKQDDCFNDFPSYRYSPLPMVLGICGAITILLISICCCVCPCCCLYKVCRKPRPVIATTTHTTVVSSTPQHYPQQPTALPTSYQAGQYPPYQPVPVQPGYGGQPMQQGYGAQPGAPTPYQGQPFTPGPPPTYQEAIGPVYPPNPMPYSQAAFTPGQPAYPLQPPVQPPQPNAPPAQPDYLAQPAFNPDYVAAPPTTGY